MHTELELLEDIENLLRFHSSLTHGEKPEFFYRV